MLDAVDWPTISKGKADAWLYFYEDFLEVYDNALRKLTGSYYTPPEVVGAERRPITKDLDPDAICTSHVERHNLSIRTFLRRFTRLALGFSKRLENLEAAIALYVAHYNFCRVHGSLSGTPAMAARLAGHPWTMDELLEAA